MDIEEPQQNVVQKRKTIKKKDQKQSAATADKHHSNKIISPKVAANRVIRKASKFVNMQRT